MKRNLKMLGLALVAVLAMSAVASASASAHFTIEESGSVVNGEVRGSAGGEQIFKATASSSLELKCTEVGGMANITGQQSTLTFTAVSFSSNEGGPCEVKGLGLPVHVETNGCHITFHTGPPAFASIECETEGEAIEVEVTKSGGGRKCLITIGSDSNAGPVSYSNGTSEGHGVVEVKSEAEEVENTTEGGLLGCGVANGTHTTGVYEGTAIGSGYNEAGKQVDAMID